MHHCLLSVSVHGCGIATYNYNKIHSVCTGSDYPTSLFWVFVKLSLHVLHSVLIMQGLP